MHSFTWESPLKQDTGFSSLELFAVALYCTNKVPRGVKNLFQLRWYLFSYVFFLIYINYYVTHVWSITWKDFASTLRSSVIEAARMPSPQLPDSEQHVWKWETVMQQQDAVMTRLPVPESTIELTVSDSKTGCSTSRCKCLKNEGLKCTEICSVRNARTLGRRISKISMIMIWKKMRNRNN